MPSFGQHSLSALATAHKDLQNLFREVIKYRDCTVLCGFRDQTDHNKAFDSGVSKEKWPNGMHNHQPSLAIDAVPFIGGSPDFHPENVRYFAGFVMGVAEMMNLGGRIRWGGDWNRNADSTDQTFADLCHYEIVLRNGETV
jgi:peptidoglycan LD-endopeptidase CwlK